MRLIKPLRLSLTQRVQTYERKHRLSVGVLTFFPLAAPDVLLPEIQLWERTADVLGATILDECRPKTRSEVLVYGTGYAPGNTPTKVFTVTLTVERGEQRLIHKRLAVVGNRHWERSGPSDPEPIASLDLSWEHAFGGARDPRNPAGKGAHPVDVDGVSVHPLPNIEDPNDLIRSMGARPRPVGFGALSPELASRTALMGTYDAAWLEKDFPGLARDMSPDYFQVAQPDQWLKGYFDGSESFTLENMHENERRLEGRVPRIVARVFAKREADESLLEVATRLETLVLFPNLERAVAIYRGNLDVSRPDAADVDTLLVAADAIEAPRPRSHFVDVWQKRIDPETGHHYMLKESDLLPPRPEGAPTFPDDRLGELEDLLAQEGAMLGRAKAFADRQLEATRLQLHILGLDPEEHGVPATFEVSEAPDLEELPAYMEKMDADIAAIRQKAAWQQQVTEEHLRQVMTVMGKDYDDEVQKNRDAAAGPPKYRAAQMLATFEQLADVGQIEDLKAQLADPSFRARLEKVEDALFSAYRRFVHMMPGAPFLDGDTSLMLRVRVDSLLAQGEPLTGLDLTGADLRGVDFQNAVLYAALLEGANLAECNLEGADLSHAVLARADLREARLVGAKLIEANLGDCDGDDLDLSGADLSGCVIQKARLRGARLSGAKLARADVMWAELAGADLSDIDAPEVMFFEQDLTGTRFAGAKLHKAVFLKCSLEGADFAGADLSEASFVECRIAGARFVGAHAPEIKFVGDTDLKETDFSGATLDRGNFRGTDLTGARIEGASAAEADLSQATLRGANLRGLRAPASRFMGTDLTGADLRDANLMDALLMDSIVVGAQLGEANLFRANLLSATGDAHTSFAGAHVVRTLYRGHDDS